MMAYALDWMNLLVRWFHFVAGISWIGASFYFVWLDDSLSAPLKQSDREDGVFGELWSVHGGGFYHNQKYLTGPQREALPQNLHWFKWEAYSTWLSGMALMAIVYWVGSGPAHIAIGIGSIVAGWLVYDGLCRLLERSPRVLAATVFAFFVFAAWAMFAVFGGREAFIEFGAIVGTIMVANVLFVIIPGQRRMLAQIRAGERPDPRPGMLGKIRSVHNTYLTLPVLFTMISYHYPMTYAPPFGWLVLIALGVAGVLVRYFFVLTHKRRMVWLLPALAVMVIAATALALVPRSASSAPVGYAQVAPVIAERCAVCHSAHPSFTGYPFAPAGVLLDTKEHIVANAGRIEAQAVRSQAMPFGNLTHMTEGERALVGAWIDQGAK